MKTLGISSGFHDAAVAIVEDGKIPFASHIERFTKKKNDPILSRSWHMPHDVAIFYEDTKLKNERREYYRMSPVEDFHKYDYRLKHHESHAAAAYYTSPFDDDVVIVCIDAIGEWTTASIWRPNGDRLDQIWDQSYPWSLGLFYSAITKRIGLKPNEDEYITMGMAAFGEPIVNMRWCFDLPDQNFHKGFQLDHFKGYALVDIAASAQLQIEREIEKIMKIARRFGSKLCYGGGVALNCVANSKVVDPMFEEVWIFPSPGDAGSSLGAALGYLGEKIEFKDCYLGFDIKNVLNPKVIVDSILAYKVVGIANGKAEFGPRALGNRSLLGDVRSNIKRKVNKIKRREQYRPFAPAILEEFADDYFEGPKNEYMQYVSYAMHDFECVKHVDGSSRVQVVKKDSSSILRKILEEYYNRTGIPMLLNTSLNIRGQPMVNDRQDAKDFENTYGVKVF